MFFLIIHHQGVAQTEDKEHQSQNDDEDLQPEKDESPFFIYPIPDFLNDTHGQQKPEGKPRNGSDRVGV